MFSSLLILLKVKIGKYLQKHKKRSKGAIVNFFALDLKLLICFQATVFFLKATAISAEPLDAYSNHICWDISKRKNVRFWTHWSNLLKGFFNISWKMAFWSFLKSQWVHLHDFHGYEDFKRKSNIFTLVLAFSMSKVYPKWKKN